MSSSRAGHLNRLLITYVLGLLVTDLAICAGKQSTRELMVSDHFFFEDYCGDA